MFGKERIREALQAQQVPSEHIRDHRVLFQTKRQFTEMLEHYRVRFAPTDRDNDPKFLHRLLAEGLETIPLLDCPFEYDEESRSSSYPLNLSESVFFAIESLERQKGWTKQRVVAALIYTALLDTYPRYNRGDTIEIQGLVYPNAPYQPNASIVKWNGTVGTISKKSSPKDPWEYVKVDGIGEPLLIRKDCIVRVKLS